MALYSYVPASAAAAAAAAVQVKLPSWLTPLLQELASVPHPAVLTPPPQQQDCGSGECGGCGDPDAAAAAAAAPLGGSLPPGLLFDVCRPPNHVLVNSYL